MIRYIRPIVHLGRTLLYRQEMRRMNVQDAIRGSLIGGAAGDALGYPVEFDSLRQIREAHGEDGIAHYQYGQEGLARISDDTQMTLFTAEGLLSAGEGGDYAAAIHRAYLTWYEMQTGRPVTDPSSRLQHVPELGRSRAPGNTCLSALGSGRCGTIDAPLNHSKGCGGIMRVAPGALVLNRGGQDDILNMDRVAAQSAAVTHGHPLGIMPAAALAHIINRIVYWNMSVGDAVKDAISGMRGMFRGQDSLEDMIYLMDQALNLSHNGRQDADNIAVLGEGWVAEETLAIAVYCAVRYPDDLSKALRAAVNHDGDSDSTGAAAGNIVGAAIGYEAIPREWKDHLECHDVILNIADALGQYGAGETSCRGREG